MSLKLETIYNYGSGGGSLKYGGILDDSDYIEIENNKIYEYNNSNRPNLNFVLKTKDQTAFFGAIQINTDVNTNVYIYELKNGLYYLLGCIGTRSITAGDSAKIFILGDSYEVQTLTDTKGMKYFVLGNQIYELEKIGNRYWTKSNAKNEPEDFGITSYFPIGRPSDQATYPGYFYTFKRNSNANALYQKAKEKLYPFRIPLESDYLDLKNAANNEINRIMKTGFDSFPNATDSTGFSCVPCGVYSFNSGISLQGYDFRMLYEIEDANGDLKPSYAEGHLTGYNNSGFTLTTLSDYTIGCLRFCCDV